MKQGLIILLIISLSIKFAFSQNKYLLTIKNFDINSNTVLFEDDVNYFEIVPENKKQNYLVGKVDSIIVSFDYFLKKVNNSSYFFIRFYINHRNSVDKLLCEQVYNVDEIKSGTIFSAENSNEENQKWFIRYYLANDIVNEKETKPITSLMNSVNEIDSVMNYNLINSCNNDTFYVSKATRDSINYPTFRFGDGGTTGFLQFVDENFILNKNYKEEVYTTVTFDCNGNILTIEFDKSNRNKKLNMEITRVLYLSKRWDAATLRGKPINCKLLIDWSVTFESCTPHIF
jgi:hypothetical protein